MTDQLERAIQMSAEAVARLDRGERVAKLIIERDQLLRQLSSEELRLFDAWAAQELPS